MRYKWVIKVMWNRHRGRKQSGVTAIEYAIIGMAISAIVLAMLTSENNQFKRALTGSISTISSHVEAAKTP